MRASVVKIGNSLGVRIPLSIRKQCDITEQVELEVHNKVITIKAVQQSRAGWDKAFMRMHDRGDDQLLIDSALDPDLCEELHV